MSQEVQCEDDTSEQVRQVASQMLPTLTTCAAVRDNSRELIDRVLIDEVNSGTLVSKAIT